jgi:hypothetical protein
VYLVVPISGLLIMFYTAAASSTQRTPRARGRHGPSADSGPASRSWKTVAIGVLVVTFFGLLLAGVPIAFSIGSASLVTLCSR